ncbi:polysaccharide deacetylase family protein [Dyadobacter sp. 32]|uniref:polysaccharide deacetylase family protein n=1 Tax=Dyadobacter sp. 32 TaxID=538966 RepID=UPI0011EE4150
MQAAFVMLTFDLEEFDIPEEFNQNIPEADQMQVTLLGLEGVLQVLNQHNIPATFFVTGNFADKHPALIRHLSQKHEIASHALFHSHARTFRESDIIHSRRILEAVTGQVVHGFRMPRLKPVDKSLLQKWGFRYDSSINPTWLPGRYNMLGQSADPHVMEGLIELPCSTTPWLRLPLFWLSFKNLPLSIYLWLSWVTLKKRGNLTLYFHPWEFADLSSYKLPPYVKCPDSQKLTTKFENFILKLKGQNVDFVTCNSFCDEWEASNRAVH